MLPKLTVLGGQPNQNAQLIPTIVGATAFAAGRTAHIAGITAKGDTLTIRLTRPTGELPARLRTSYFCPVPIGTPAVPGGGKQTPIPMAGPYHMLSISDGQVVVERNPNYGGDRPRRIERIVYTDGFKAPDAISRVKDGRADYVNGWAVSFDPAGPLAPGGALDSALPGLVSRAGRSGGARYLPSPAPGFDGLAFNTKRPLFRDVRMRRAVTPRARSARAPVVFGDQPSDHLIPAAVRGPGGNIAYADEPNIRAARRLVSPGPRRNAEALLLRRPHQQARRRDRPGQPRRDPHRRAHRRGSQVSHGAEAGPDRGLGHPAHLARRTRDRPGAVRRSPLGRRVAPGYWQNARMRTRSRALTLCAARRGSRPTRLEKALVRDAVPVTVRGNYVTPEFFSARIGCRVSQGALNFADLGALCLRE